MNSRKETLLRAIQRWEERGVLPSEIGATLRTDVHETERNAGRNRIRFLLAGTGVLVLLIAIIVLMTWAWPQVGEVTQLLLLAGSGVAVQLGGVAVERRGSRWWPASYGMQTVGLVVLLGAALYSKEIWLDGTSVGFVVGAVAVVYPVLTGLHSLGRNRIVPAIHLALGFAFLAVGLDRITPFDGETIVWILDACLALTGIGLALGISRRDPGATLSWVGPGFIAAMYSALALVIVTQVVAFELGDEVVYGVDAWWAVVTALTLWGVHLAPADLRRNWYGAQLGVWVFLGVGLVFWSLLGPVDTPETIVALAVAMYSGLFLVYGERTGNGPVLFAACAGILIAAWYYGVEKEGLLPTAIALGVSASLLIGLSVRIGSRKKEPESP